MRRVLLLFILGMFVFFFASLGEVRAACTASNSTCGIGDLVDKVTSRLDNGDLIISVKNAPATSLNRTLCVGLDIDSNGNVLDGTELQNITIDSTGAGSVNMGPVTGGRYIAEVYNGNIIIGLLSSQTLCGGNEIIIEGPTATPTVTPANPDCLSVAKNSPCFSYLVNDGSQKLCYPETEICDPNRDIVVKSGNQITEEDLSKYAYDSFKSDKLGTYGNACWMRSKVIDEDKLLPHFSPVVDSLVDKINNSLIKPIFTPMNGLATSVNRLLRGNQICKDSVPYLRDGTGRFIGEKDGDYNTIDQYFSALGQAWEDGDWTKFETGRYSKFDCQCTGEDDPISEYPEGVAPPVEGGENVQGISTVRATLNAKIISAEACSENKLVKKITFTCATAKCSKVLFDGEYDDCWSCLLKNKSYITGSFYRNPSDKCVDTTAANLCKPLIGLDKEDELKKCIDCISNKEGMWTSIGCMYTDLQKTINEQLFGLLIGIGGISVLGCIIFAAFRMQTSAGNPEQVKAAQDMATSCITGLIIIIFSVFILRVIGVDILRIPFLS